MPSTNYTANPESQVLPWYHYGWPWFLISIPFVSVTLGAVMLYLALQTNNSLVVDDYYKEGKAYNLRIERDRLASLLGLEALLTQTDEGLVIQLVQQSPMQLPEALKLKARNAAAAWQSPTAGLSLSWIHVTHSSLDGQVMMHPMGGDRFIAVGAGLPEDGKYRLHIQPLQSSFSGEAVHGNQLGSPITYDNAAHNPGIDNESWRLIGLLQSFDKNVENRVTSPVYSRVFPQSAL